MTDKREHVPSDDSDLLRDKAIDDDTAADETGLDGSAITSTGRVGGLGSTGDRAPADERSEDETGDPGFSGRIIDTDAELRRRDTELPD